MDELYKGAKIMNKIYDTSKLIFSIFFLSLITLDVIQSPNASEVEEKNKCEFRCNSSECLPFTLVCDGKSDCKDGSDESEEQCSILQCGCKLPQHPVNGKYKLTNGNVYLERTVVKSLTVINLTCIPDFIPWGTRTFTCLGNSWRPSLHGGHCLRLCPPLKSTDSYDVSCSFQRQTVSCEEAVVSTFARITCKPNYTHEGPMPLLLCLVFGSWDQELPECKPSKTNSGCLLPRHLPNGKYKLISGDAYVENKLTPSSTAIVLTCDPGYLTSQIQLFFCFNNNWLPQLDQGTCTGTCPTLTSTDSYDVKCNLHGQEVACETPVEETTASVLCKPFYQYVGVRGISACQKGFWNPEPVPCQIVCGQKTVNAEPLIGGGNTVQGEYPWVVAIYKIVTGEKQQICGGSIISRFYVLSAAHCFTNVMGEAHDKNLYTVVAGKYYRDLNVAESGIQIRKISKLSIHQNYRGSWHKFRDDIALITVDEKFELSPQVQLVCLDWENEYEEFDFIENNTAVVTGWGFTKETLSPSEVLKKLVVPYRSLEVCKRDIDADFFQQYFVSSKFCAGYKGKDSSVCNGDSGGGLFFKSMGTRHFVRGIVSIAPRSAIGCNSNHYALYTKVSSYLKWIKRITRKVL